MIDELIHSTPDGNPSNNPYYPRFLGRIAIDFGHELTHMYRRRLAHNTSLVIGGSQTAVILKHPRIYYGEDIERGEAGDS